MSAHRTLKDLFKAFTTGIGPGILQDPGNAGTITVEHYGQVCEMTSTGVETRTKSRPDRPGIPFYLRLYTDGGDVTVTFTGGINAEGDTSAVFADAGDFMQLVSVQASATTYRWQVIPASGSVPTIELASTTPSATPSHTPSHTPS